MAEILSIGELLDLGGSASTAGLIPYSALEYSAQVITGISGTAIGGQGGTDSATVSAIASAYAESAASGKLDNSASGLWYPLTGNPSGFLTSVDLTPYAYASSVSAKVDQSAFDNCCSSMSSVVSSLETSVTSMSSVVSGLTGDYLEKSASSMFQPSGDYQTAGDYAFNSSVSSKLDASASSQFAPSGDYADKSALSSYVPVSASGQFAPSGDYAYNSALSGKLDASASSQFQPSGNYQTAGDYAYNSSLSDYQDRSSISAWTGDMSSISAKLDQSAFTSYSSTVNNNITSIENNITAISSVVSGKADASAVHEYIGVSPIVVDNTADTISLSASSIYFDSSMMSYVSGGSGFVGVNSAGMQPSGDYAYRSSLAMYAYNSALSSKLDASASSDFYSTGNPSGFLTSSYTPTFGYDGDKISSIDGSALAGGGGAYTSPSGTVAIDNENSTIDVWNSSMRVDEHVTAASSSPGTAQQLYNSNNVGQWSAVWTGGTLSGDIAVFSAIYPREVPPKDGYNVRAFGIKEGGGTAQLAEFNIAREVFSPYSGSATASASINEAYTSIYMLVSGKNGVPSTGQYSQSVSGITNVERPGATASATAVYENVLKDSMWQSLTAWAVAQGWTP